MDGVAFLPDTAAVAAVALGFVAGGLAKGVFGLGMPLVGLPVMVLAIPYPTAVALFLVPNFTANGQQMFEGGRLAANLRRFATLIVPMLAVIPLSVKLLVSISAETSLLVLGGLCVIFAVYQMFPLSFDCPPQRERWLNPIVGVIAGALAGLSGIYGPVLIVYLMALRMPKDDFVAALSMMYFMGSVMIAAMLAREAVITLEVLAASAVGAAIIGAMMVLGRIVRRRIDEARYRKLILVLLMVMGADMIRRGAFG
ncbi:MAG: sulfite exporter TauE/SafE family protein [Rhodospirillaceae bacterium]|nr:sulfite exporter TauE/SafE family protein [Rhodospirillaceae bacterium]